MTRKDWFAKIKAELFQKTVFEENVAVNAEKLYRVLQAMEPIIAILFEGEDTGEKKLDVVLIRSLFQSLLELLDSQ